MSEHKELVRDAHKEFARRYGAVAYVTNSAGRLLGLAPMDPPPDGFRLNRVETACVPDMRTLLGRKIAAEIEQEVREPERMAAAIGRTGLYEEAA